MIISQGVDVTNLKSEINKQIGLSTAKTAQAEKLRNSRRSKKIIVGSRNYGGTEKVRTVGTSRPMTPHSNKSNNNLNTDLVIFEDRADTKLLAHDGVDKKVKDA